MYFWALNEIGKFGWMVVLIYTVCCALRLARFNLMTIEENETWKINFFEGVPSPAAAGLVLLPLILNLSGLIQLENYAVLSFYSNFNNIDFYGKQNTHLFLKKDFNPKALCNFFIIRNWNLCQSYNFLYF